MKITNIYNLSGCSQLQCGIPRRCMDKESDTIFQSIQENMLINNSSQNFRLDILKNKPEIFSKSKKKKLTCSVFNSGSNTIYTQRAIMHDEVI